MEDQQCSEYPINIPQSPINYHVETDAEIVRTILEVCGGLIIPFCIYSSKLFETVLKMFESFFAHRPYHPSIFTLTFLLKGLTVLGFTTICSETCEQMTINVA